MTYAKEQNLKFSREKQFCRFFHAFEIKEGTYIELGESKEEISLQDS